MLVPAFFTSEPLSFICPPAVLLFPCAMPRNGIKAGDSAIIATINVFITLRFIFILALCTARISESVRCRTYSVGWGVKRGRKRRVLPEQAIIFGPDDLVAFAGATL